MILREMISREMILADGPARFEKKRTWDFKKTAAGLTAPPDYVESDYFLTTWPRTSPPGLAAVWMLT
jgi:hypothetical protein